MAALELRKLRKTFGEVEILHEIDLTIYDGEFVVFVGPSGCGKSTMLRCIAGLEDITSGELWIGDQKVNDVPPAKRSISMVFQSYALYPHMNVARNMAFGLRLAGYVASEIDAAVKRAAAILRIEHLLDRKPKDLSGGQRQRVAIGRAIVRKPGVFLFDEPLSNLDAALRVQMRVELARLHRELGTTMVYVTHDQVEAMTLADRIVVFHDGRIEQVGTPNELYQRPVNLFVAGFIGSPNMNFIPVRMVHSETDTAVVETVDGVHLQVKVDAGAVESGAPLTLGVRPEHMDVHTSATSAQNVIAATVLASEHLGDVTYLHLNVAGDVTAIARTDPENTLEIGDRAVVHLPPQRLQLFDVQGRALLRTA
jgi:multiple sugar transport system ATP-binding protein